MDRLPVSAGTPGGRLPDFLVIGAMKGGSTTLWGLLARHPQIFMCEPKEPQFFSNPDRPGRDLAWYRALFAGARPDQLAGEASTCYSRWPHHGDVAARIAARLPRVKLVYQLRHPIDRAYSHYRHLMEERVAKGIGPTIAFADAVIELPEILDASRYLVQIEQYLAHFPREQLHVLTLEDLRARRQETWRGLQAFLGVSPLDLASDPLPVDNPSGTKVARSGMRRIIRRVRALPGWAAVKRLVPAALRREGRTYLLRPDVARRLQGARVREYAHEILPLDPALRRLLAERLEEPTRALERFLGRELPEWHH
jgi:hypothetical protein